MDPVKFLYSDFLLKHYGSVSILLVMKLITADIGLWLRFVLGTGTVTLVLHHGFTYIFRPIMAEKFRVQCSEFDVTYFLSSVRGH